MSATHTDGAPHEKDALFRGILALCGLGCALTFASPTVALADPQVNAGITIGVAGRGFQREVWTDTEFHLGLRGDVLFGRDSTKNFGFGPYVEVLTNGFDEVQFGGGGSLLLPIIDSLPLIVSAGAYGRQGSEGFGVEPGFAASLFFGSKSYNFNSNYVMTAGLLSEFRVGFGDSKEMSIILSAHLDLAFLSLPLVYIVDAIRGGSHETDRVPPKPPAQAHM